MSNTLHSLERIAFKAGDYLFREGEQSFHFFMIEEGEVDVVLNDPANPGREIHLATVSDGQPVGEFALVASAPRSASARAKTNGTAIKISETGYRQLLTELPEWGMSLIKSLIERLRRTDEMLRKIQAEQQVTREQLKKILSSSES
jgi:CRP-like cAMP-binding protein